MNHSHAGTWDSIFDGNEGSAHGSSSAGSCRAERRGEISRTSGLCEEDGPLFDAEFHYYYQQLKAMHDNGWIFEEAAKKEKKSLELKGIAQYMDIKELSRPIVEELVDVIYFYDPEHIEVVWNFKDDLPDYTK